MIKVYVNTDKDVKFQNLWLGQQNVPFSVEFTNTEIPKKIMQGDTLLLVANVVNNEPSEKLLPERPPVKYKGGAIFETLVGGKHRYFIVSRFKQLASLRGE